MLQVLKNGVAEPYWNKITSVLTNIDTVISVHKYNSSLPPIGHPAENNGYQEQGCALVLHGLRFSEMAENTTVGILILATLL